MRLFYLGFVAFVLVASPLVARADFKLCNKISSPISAAIGYKNDRNQWVSEGWYELKVGQCRTLFEESVERRKIYLTAKDLTNGGGWVGDTQLCVRNRDFMIVSAQDCIGRGYDNRGFLKIDSKGKHSFTVNLEEE